MWDRQPHWVSLLGYRRVLNGRIMYWVRLPCHECLWFLGQLHGCSCMPGYEDGTYNRIICFVINATWWLCYSGYTVPVVESNPVAGHRNQILCCFPLIKKNRNFHSWFWLIDFLIMFFIESIYSLFCSLPSHELQIPCFTLMLDKVLVNEVISKETSSGTMAIFCGKHRSTRQFTCARVNVNHACWENIAQHVN
jgi:hypothetical protein